MKNLWKALLLLATLLTANAHLAAQLTAPEPITADNVGSLQLQAYIPQTGGQFYDVNWSPDGRTLAIATPLGARTFDLLQPIDEPTMIYEPTEWAGCVDFALDRSVFISCDAASPTMWLWDRITGEKLATVTVGSIVAHARFSPDGRFLAVVTNQDQGLYLWGVNGGLDPITAANASSLRQIKVLDTGVRSGTFSFSGDGILLATSSRNGLLQIWDTGTFELRMQQTEDAPNYDAPVYSLSFSSDGQSLVMGTYINDHYLLQMLSSDASQPRDIGADVPMDAPNDVAFSPNAKLIASAHNDGLVNIWNVDNGRLLHTIQPEGGLAHAIAFNRDGSLLATVNFNDGVRVWGIGDALARIPKPVLTVGANAIVTLITEGDVLNMRAEAGTNAALLVQLRHNTLVTVVDGPLVVDGLTWWKVRNANGVEGWVVESVDGEQTLTPDS